MTDWTGENLKLKLIGASHADFVGAILSGIDKGEKIDIGTLNELVALRRPGDEAYSTGRKEHDDFVFESGVDADFVTTGDDIVVKIKNNDANSSDYEKFSGLVRPSHADYAAYAKYGKNADLRGGGIFSGRMTAPLCVVGGVALSILKRKNISICAYLNSVGNIKFASYDDEKFVLPDKIAPFIAATDLQKEQADNLFSALKKEGDSVGGSIECVVAGVPAGLGDAQFGSIEGRFSSILFGIPAVKAVEFGLGKNFACALGSKVRDEFYYDGDKVKTLTNFNGGINGGISNGMPIMLRVAIKPTPSIARTCRTIDVKNKKEVLLNIPGRHDVCIAPRAVPAVAAAVAIAVLDLMENNR